MRLLHTLRPVALGLLGLLGLLSTRAAHAQQPQPAVQVTQPDAASLRVRLDNPGRQRARLLVLDLSRSASLLNETHREPAYGTLLKFNTLPTGRYVVILSVGRARYRYSVQAQARPEGTTIVVRGLSTRQPDNVLAEAN